MHIHHNAERNCLSPAVADEGWDISILGVRTMDSPILRLAKSTVAVEEGMLVAGVTITGVAIIQTAVILLTWIFP
jgi:hypothetical protein